MERKTIRASEGMILTDGENYGTVVYLADGADESAWQEIPVEEYEKIMNGEPDEQAEEADYLAALERFGVK